MTYPAKPPIKMTLLAAVFLLAVAGADSALYAQGRGGAGARAAARARDTELYNREMALKNLGKEAGKPSKRDQALALQQIKEDFESIQSINNEMMREQFNAESLDYKRISGVTAEINKRARRLKTNLGMADVEADKKGVKHEIGEAEQMKASLNALDDLIMSFVSNPLFQNPKVVDAQLSKQAGNDLLGIIELSNSIRKSAERLDKAR